MRGLRFLAAMLIVIWSGGVVSSQSLADIARKEEERRKTVKTQSKVYTNQDLRPGRSVAVPPSSTATSTSSSTSSGGETAAAGPETPGAGAGPQADAPPPEKRDQKYWKDRLAAAQLAVERARVMADAMQTRINSLNADFVNTDDPARRAVVERDRQRALAELNRLKEEVAAGAERIAEIEDEARRANVPPGWLR